MPTRSVHPKAFSLIELLVVISIIVLLIAILLPALQASRDVARSALCLSNLRQMGIATNVYIVDNDGFIPGPNTSGYSPAPGDRADKPIFRDDWMSPTLGNYLGLSSNRNERLIQIFNDEFRCAANPHVYNYIYPSGSGWPDPSSVNYNSYSAAISLHHYYDSSQAQRLGQPGGLVIGDSRERGAVRLPDSAHTKFNLDNFDQPSLKSVAFDGSRYVDGSGQISFNVNGAGSQYGVNFMNRGPTLNANTTENGNPYTYIGSPETLHPRAAKYAYRHPNDTLNITFHDGHAASFDSVGSRRIEFYYPAGSIVLQPASVGDPDVYRGYVVK